MKVIVNIVCMVLVALLAALALSQVVGVKYFSVVSGSMEPEIPTGSLVVTVPESLSGQAEPGDIISYVADENLTVVTHRVVTRDYEGSTLTTQGDANEAADPPVHSANVVGKVLVTVPAIGIPLSYLSTTTGKIIVITALVTLFLLVTLANLLTQKKPQRRLVISYDDEADLNAETFSRIAQGLQERRGEKS